MVPALQVPKGPFGVILNANAGRVTPRLHQAISQVVSPDHIFMTESQDHAKEVLEKCLEREYRTVFAGGGDGTIMDTVNTLEAYRQDVDALPSVGVLRLGTGNAMARWLGSKSPVKDLANFQAGDVHRSHPLRMIRAEGALCPFGGMGYDAAVLNDYYSLKNRFDDTALRKMFRGMSGYLIAAVTKTVPSYASQEMPEVTIINHGRPAYSIGANGEEVGDPVLTGEVLYQGPASVLSAGATPQIGYGLRLFPFAGLRAGKFQLRVASLNPIQALWNLPATARGTLRHPKLHDFYVDKVQIISNNEMPFQLGGDPKGYRNEVTLEVANHEVNFIGRA